ncbi:MAG: hypothetical protein CVT92_05235 [Bacteroidetes bacterium HGW-Bacteroidetes-1]|jgi:PAS domain S-box-containing protein|nr:MAG: hypothetical protein CVT92_05235 [Bacteroidetes bacterium HGW-Bacteroidetes-1]
MKRTDTEFERLSLLRQKAEEALVNQQSEKNQSFHEFDALKLVHELEVHQIELEMQNHELKLALENAEAAKMLYEFSPTGYFSLDFESVIKALNFSAAKMIGKPRSELIGKSFKSFIAKEDRNVFNSFLEKVFESETKQIAELRFAIDGNPLLYVHIEGVVLDHPLQCLVTVVDITHQKLLEKSLRESEDKLFKQNVLLSTLLENLQIGVFMVESPSDKPLLANTIALDLLGRGILPDASVKNLSEAYMAYKLESGEPYPPEEMPVLKAISGESSYVDDMLIKRPDGSQVILEVFGSPVKDKEGKIWASLVSFSDITSRKELEKKLKENEARLEQLNITKDKFFSIIAHDLTNPFNSILGLSEVLVERIQEKEYEDIEKIGSLILNTSQSTYALLSNLLQWTRKQTGKIKFEPELFYMDSLATEIIDSLNVFAEQKNIVIKNDIPAKMKVWGDKPMISTILRNLLTNAVKFTHNGGKVVLSAKTEADECIVSVSDNGVGIQKEVIEKIFLI